jgi:arylsulfatase A-like enzyme
MKLLKQVKIVFFALFLAHAALANSGFKNAVIVFIDDLGYGDTGPYGVEDIPTPHIDQLAREGVVFTQLYVPGPPCCPSRSSLVMGMYPQRFGKYGMSRGLPLPEDKPTLAEHLVDHGYHTGHIGKWDIGAKNQVPLSTGFMEVEKKPHLKVYTNEEMESLSKSDTRLYKALKKRKRKSKYIYIKEDGTEGWLTDYEGDMMVEFIEKHHDEPFFLYFSPNAVHSINWEAPERLQNRTTATGARRALAGAIVSVDDQVGKLLGVLDRHGIRENTLIIFSSDNGPNPNEGGSAAPYRGGKFGVNTQYEGWVHVPGIFSLPGIIPEGERFDGLSSTLDFYATITALNGLKTPQQCDGVNLLPYLQKEKEGDPHEYIFWLNNDPDDMKHRHLTAARWKDYRLHLSKEPGVGWQLFNIRLDPREENDIATEFPEIVQQMIQKHELWCRTHVEPPAKPGFIKKSTYPQTPKGYGLWDGN